MVTFTSSLEHCLLISVPGALQNTFTAEQRQYRHSIHFCGLDGWISHRSTQYTKMCPCWLVCRASCGGRSRFRPDNRFRAVDVRACIADRTDMFSPPSCVNFVLFVSSSGWEWRCDWYPRLFALLTYGVSGAIENRTWTCSVTTGVLQRRPNCRTSRYNIGNVAASSACCRPPASTMITWLPLHWPFRNGEYKQIFRCHPLSCRRAPPHCFELTLIINQI